MINFIVGLLTMLLVTFLFTKIRGFIFNRAKAKARVKLLAKKLSKDEKALKEISENYLKSYKGSLNASVGNVYKKNRGEVFQWKKFKKVFDLGSGGEWAKSIKEIIDLRKLVVYSIILGSIFAYGYFKGKGNTPVKINLSYEKEWVMNINGEELYKPKFSNDVFIRDSKTKQILKQIKAKDMGELRKKLKPIGFILEPIFVAGGSVGGTENKGEIGAGVSFIKYWRWRLDAFLTSYPAGYIGTSYAITENSGAGLGVGKGLSDGSSRVILYYKFKF